MHVFFSIIFGGEIGRGRLEEEDWKGRSEIETLRSVMEYGGMTGLFISANGANATSLVKETRDGAAATENGGEKDGTKQ